MLLVQTKTLAKSSHKILLSLFALSANKTMTQTDNKSTPSSDYQHHANQTLSGS